jgi:hypothetical protein
MARAEVQPRPHLPGETTVSQLNSPIGMSVFFNKPENFSVKFERLLLVIDHHASNYNF